MSDKIKAILISLSITLTYSLLYIVIFDDTIMEYGDLPFAILCSQTLTVWTIKKIEPFLVKIFKINVNNLKSKSDDEHPTNPDS